MTSLFLKRFIKSWEIVFSLVAGITGLFLIGSLLPIPGNYKLLIVESGSMQPAIPVGSIVMVKSEKEYAVDDIVTFAPSLKEKNKYVTHRIHAFSSEVFGLVYQTKGDANKVPDSTSIPLENILGKVVLILPYVGLIFNKIKTPLGFMLVVVVPATIVIYEETKKVYTTLVSEVKNYFQKRRQPVLTRQDQNLLKEVEQLRQKREVKLDATVGVFCLFVGFGFAFAGITHGFFSDIEVGSATLTVGLSSPVPSASPTTSPSPLAPHIVINEVFYDVDPSHGLDNPGDRGVIVDGHPTQVRIAGNGAGSHNSVFVDSEIVCQVIQNNTTETTIDLNISGNTGNNQNLGNTSGNFSTPAGNVNNNVNAHITSGNNTLNDFCGSALGRNDEWIELYNPTDQTVNLKNWTITDNSGISVKIPGNRLLGPGKFALISKSNATWAFWRVPSGTLKIPLGRQIGDGLDNLGDRLILKNTTGDTIDQMSYGDDTSVFHLSGVAQGHSLERNPDGLDTNTSFDWVDRFPPQPGS